MTRRARGANAPEATRRQRSPAASRTRVLAGAVAVAAVAVVAFAVARAATGTAHGTAGPAASASARAVKAPRSAAPRRVPRQRAAPGTIGSYRVARQRLTLVDRSRPGLGPRVLPAIVRYPVIPASAAASGSLAHGPFPLVIFAPGFRQCDGSYRHLLHQWASAGYVVAAVEFPRTSCVAARPDENDLVNQPGDVSFVISRLLALGRRPGSVLSGLVDGAEVAVAGHSDGGDAMAAVAADTCCRDPRVGAAVLLAGAEWPGMGGHWFSHRTVPMLFVQGTADTWNPAAASRQLYQADATGARFYLNLFGANHFTPYEGSGAPEPVVARVSVAFLDRYLAGQHRSAAVMRRAGDVSGIAELASGGRLP